VNAAWDVWSKLGIAGACIGLLYLILNPVFKAIALRIQNTQGDGEVLRRLAELESRPRPTGKQLTEEQYELFLAVIRSIEQIEEELKDARKSEIIRREEMAKLRLQTEWMWAHIMRGGKIDGIRAGAFVENSPLSLISPSVRGDFAQYRKELTQFFDTHRSVVELETKSVPGEERFDYLMMLSLESKFGDIISSVVKKHPEITNSTGLWMALFVASNRDLLGDSEVKSKV